MKLSQYTKPPVFTNPTHEEFLKLMMQYENVRGVLEGKNLFVAPADYYTHHQIAKDQKFEYNLDGRLWFKRLPNNDVLVTYETQQIGNIYNIPAFRQLGFDPHTDILSLGGKPPQPKVRYDPQRHDFRKAKDYSDMESLKYDIANGGLSEGDVATNGEWLYEVFEGKPVRIRGVAQKYDYERNTYGPNITNFSPPQAAVQENRQVMQNV